MFRQLDGAAIDSVRVVLDGEQLVVPAGISVAAALLLAGLTSVRTTPVTGSPRGPFCMMGVCFDCLMQIDGQPNQRACLSTVREGMQLQRQHGAARLDAGA